MTKVLQLSTNESPYGPSPLVQIKAAHRLKEAHRYTQDAYMALKQIVADFLDVSCSMVVVGNGSEHILELIIKRFINPPQQALFSQYSFITIKQLLEQYRIKTHIIAANNYAHHLNAIAAKIDTYTRIIFLVNPNNPTTTYFTALEFAAFMQAVPPHVLVVLDEAYYEYMSAYPLYPASISLLNTYANLIIVRTFSKAYGLAGFRLGYAITSPTLATQLESACLPYAINTLVAGIAEAALQDQVYLKKIIALTNQGRLQLEQGLKKLHFPFLSTAGNFICIETKNAMTASHLLQQKNIMVKPLLAYDMPKHIRITIGTIEQNEFFLRNFEKVAPTISLS